VTYNSSNPLLNKIGGKTLFFIKSEPFYFSIEFPCHAVNFDNKTLVVKFDKKVDSWSLNLKANFLSLNSAHVDSTSKTISECQLIFSYQLNLVNLALDFKLLKTHGDSELNPGPTNDVTETPVPSQLPLGYQPFLSNPPVFLSNC
jgi:hypothetical protein